MPLIPEAEAERQTEKQRKRERGRGQVDLCEFEICLVYRVSFRTARAPQRNPVWKKNRGKKKKKVKEKVPMFS